MTNQMVDESNVNWLLSSAHSYLSQNMASQAITLLELLDALQPNNRQALRMLAYAYLLAARYEQVLETATTLEQFKQDDDEQAAYLSLLRARALWGLGETEESKAHFQRYIHLVASLKLGSAKRENG